MNFTNKQKHIYECHETIFKIKIQFNEKIKKGRMFGPPTQYTVVEGCGYIWGIYCVNASIENNKPTPRVCLDP